MRPAARILAAVTLLLLAACTAGGERALPSSTSTAPSVSASPSPSASTSPTGPASPSISPSPTAAPVILPPGVPATYPRDDDQAALAYDRMVPAGAEVTGTWFPDRTTVVLTWGAGDDPFLREQGLVVWRHSGSRPPWLATYAFRDPKKAGVLGIQVVTGDVTGDGRADALAFENTGGSGACGTWRVVALSPEGDGPTFTKDLCDGSVEISADPVGIRLIQSVYGPTDPHCCPSAVRTSTLEWNGTRWRVTSREQHDL